MTIILKLSYVAYSVLNIRPLNLVLIKKNQQLHSRPKYWNDNEAAPANSGFVNKANGYVGPISRMCQSAYFQLNNICSQDSTLLDCQCMQDNRAYTRNIKGGLR